MTILVLGSINMDLVARTPRLPAPAETIIGRDFFTAPGGKGANQAVASARLGASTMMLGRVGDDTFGPALQQALAQAGVDISAVAVGENISSGVALIAVNDAGQNNIIVIPGANGQVGQTELERLESLLPQATALLLQLEIPLETTLKAAQMAHQQGVPVILDPAPAQKELPSALFKAIDIITPNEVEAEQLVGFAVQTRAEAQRAAKALQAKGAPTVIIKMGAQGAYYCSENEEGFVPAFKVKTVDTVAAGDAFNGGLAVALGQSLSLAEAVRWGAAVGALSTTQAGAQGSMPDKAAVLGMLGD